VRVLKNLEVRKLIAVILVVSYILLMLVLTGYTVITGKEVRMPAEFAAFASLVSLIVGTYFGKSTLAEGSKMNKDP
jgi:hypothetical protein